MSHAVLLLLLVLPGGSPATELAPVAELERCKDPVEAVRIAQRIERSYPVRKPPWRELYRTAVALQRLGLVDLACRLVRDHWKLCGGEFEYGAHALMAELFLRAGRLDDALPEAEQALYLAQVWEGRKGWDGRVQDAHLRLARVYHGRLDWRRAAMHYRASASKNHEMEIADCMVRSGQGEAAREALLKLILQRPMSRARRALRLYALSAHEDGKLAEAAVRLDGLGRKARSRLRTPLGLFAGFAKGDPAAIVESFARRPSRESYLEVDRRTAAAYLARLDRARVVTALRRRIEGGELSTVDIVALTDLRELASALEARAAREQDADRRSRIQKALRAVHPAADRD